MPGLTLSDLTYRELFFTEMQGDSYEMGVFLLFFTKNKRQNRNMIRKFYACGSGTIHISFGRK